MGVSEDTIKRIESGKGTKLDVAYTIAEVLKVPFQSLFPQQDIQSKSELVDKIHDAQDVLQIFLEILEKK